LSPQEFLKRILARETVQQRPPPLPRNRLFEQFLAGGGEFLEPIFVFDGKILFKSFSQALRESGAVAASGDGDLERAAADHRAVVEIAVRGVVDHIAQNAAAPRFPENSGVKRGRGRGGHGEKNVLQIGRPKFARVPTDLSGAGPSANAIGCDGRYHANVRLGSEKAFDFFLGDSPRSDDEAAASGEFQKGGKERH
jgi:hypothetical protein